MSDNLNIELLDNPLIQKWPQSPQDWITFTVEISKVLAAYTDTDALQVNIDGVDTSLGAEVTSLDAEVTSLDAEVTSLETRISYFEILGSMGSL